MSEGRILDDEGSFSFSSWDCYELELGFGGWFDMYGVRVTTEVLVHISHV